MHRQEILEFFEPRVSLEITGYNSFLLKRKNQRSKEAGSFIQGPTQPVSYRARVRAQSSRRLRVYFFRDRLFSLFIRVCLYESPENNNDDDAHKRASLKKGPPSTLYLLDFLFCFSV